MAFYIKLYSQSMGYLWVFDTEIERAWHYGLGYVNICLF